jgi:hypothetical protein
MPLLWHKGIIDKKRGGGHEIFIHVIMMMARIQERAKLRPPIIVATSSSSS